MTRINSEHMSEIMKTAAVEATAHGLNEPGPEHIMLALAIVRPGATRLILDQFGLDVRNVRSCIDEILRNHPNRHAAVPQAFQKVFDSAMSMSVELGHCEVMPGHLLLALLSLQDSLVVDLMRHLGRDPDEVRKSALDVLAEDNRSHISRRAKRYASQPDVGSILDRIELLNEAKEQAVAQQQFRLGAQIRAQGFDLEDELERAVAVREKENKGDAPLC